jgi:hypothetical protein
MIDSIQGVRAMKNRKKTVRRQLAAAGAAAAAVTLAAAGSAAASSGYRSIRTTRAAPAAATASAEVVSKTLKIDGTNQADHISVSLDPGNANLLVVDLENNQTPQRFDRATFSAISVSLFDGDDQFMESHGFADVPTFVDGGSGNDTITTGDGNDLIFGGTGDDMVDGGVGHDTAFLGGGRDTFKWDPGDGSDFIDGGDGFDTLLFNGANASETMSLSAVGTRAVFLRDVANIRMDMDNMEGLELNALGGADSITINDMTGTSFRAEDINLASQAGTPDGAADTVTVNGTDKNDHVDVIADPTTVDVLGLSTATTIRGSEPADHLQVNTLGGNDRVDAAPSVSNVIGVGVDLGADQH